MIQQPLSIQDALELKIDSGIQAHELHEDPLSNGECDLTKKDVKALFSGAPHFLLERGSDTFHPQVIFPWDEHNGSIQNMTDRQPMAHRAFASSTLHPHLPASDESAAKGHVASLDLDSLDPESIKRPIFDIGIFEIPNMLSLNGWEPGSVGFRYYLELPVSDSTKMHGAGPPRLCNELRDFSSTPASMAYEVMEHREDPYSECRNGTVHSRQQLLSYGPTAWKRIGLRDVEFTVMIDRLENLRRIRQECVRESTTKKTLLDYESPPRLHELLFSTFIHQAPERLVNTYFEDPRSMKSQIKMLLHILAVPGAWFDFSLVESRFRAGQVLWEAPPHPDGDYLDLDTCEFSEQRPWISTFLERKWFFFQMLLSAELLLRLDAVAHLHRTGGRFGLMERDMHNFNDLRSGKVNWDLVAVRQFLDNFSLSCINVEPEESSTSEVSTSPPSTSPERLSERHPVRNLFSSIKHRLSTPAPTAKDWASWMCKLVPLHTIRQLEGLFTFGEEIGWPNMDEFKKRMVSKVMKGDSNSVNELIYERPVCNAVTSTLGKQGKRHRKPFCFPVYLHCAEGGEADAGVGGWMSRSWLSGFILPGESTSHLLMATILENDPVALKETGPIANFYGGFLYAGKTWWSKTSVIGRVLASLDSSKECMGWIGCDVVPRHAKSSSPFENTWFEVTSEPLPNDKSEIPRVEQGSKVIRQSLPLGVGALSGEAFSLPKDGLSDSLPDSEVKFDNLMLSVELEKGDDGAALTAKSIHVATEATVSFQVRWETEEEPKILYFPLIYDVYFISAHECRPPPGRAAYHESTTNKTSPDFIGLRSHNRNRTSSTSSSSPSPSPSPVRVPGHPLHTWFAYRWVSLSSLPETSAPPPLHNFKEGNEPEAKNNEVLIIDARGCGTKQAFARAWCAYVGTDAVVGRTGKTCLSCCIREAHAANVGVVIRV